MPGGRLILAGVDEAGYGPLLGPLCVGMSVFSLPIPASTDHDALDLWKVLSSGVTRERPRAKDASKGDAAGRVAIADSKVLRLPTHTATTHPLTHLERGVLALLPGAELPSSDAHLLALLGAGLPPQPWYQGEATALPLTLAPAQARIARNLVVRSLAAADVRVESISLHVLDEKSFNDLARVGGKAATTWWCVERHLRTVFEEFALHASPESGGVGLVCDRLGGRMSYAQALERAVPGATVTILEESEARSRYVIERMDPSGRRRMGVSFLVEGERHHLPVALASMLAKLSRELLMLRFNRWWESRARALGLVELKPTAGYASDALRWLRDATDVVSQDERSALTRIA